MKMKEFGPGRRIPGALLVPPMIKRNNHCGVVPISLIKRAHMHVSSYVKRKIRTVTNVSLQTYRTFDNGNVIFKWYE